MKSIVVKVIGNMNMDAIKLALTSDCYLERIKVIEYKPRKRVCYVNTCDSMRCNSCSRNPYLTDKYRKARAK